MTDILRQLSEPRRRQQPGTEKSQTVPKGDILVEWARKCNIEPGQNENIYYLLTISILLNAPGHVAQSVGHLTRKSGVLGSIPGLATYFRFSFRFFKKGSCQLLAKVCARSTG